MVHPGRVRHPFVGAGRRRPAVSVVALAATALLTAGCSSSGDTPLLSPLGAPTSTTSPGSGTRSDQPTSPTAGVAVAPSSTTSSLAGADSTPADGDTGAPAEVAAGTDSALTLAPGDLDPGVRDTITAFGQAYLAFDYRETDADRAARMQPLVAEDLLVELSQPLPLALLQELADTERVVTATPVEVVAVSPGVYQAVFETTTVSAGTDTVTGRRLLTVVLDDTGLVDDVR